MRQEERNVSLNPFSPLSSNLKRAVHLPVAQPSSAPIISKADTSSTPSTSIFCQWIFDSTEDKKALLKGKNANKLSENLNVIIYTISQVYKESHITIAVNCTVQCLVNPSTCLVLLYLVACIVSPWLIFKILKLPDFLNYSICLECCSYHGWCYGLWLQVESHV